MEKQKVQPKATITSIIVAGRRRLNYTYEDSSEMIEEYDMKSHELLIRKMRKQSHVKESKWEYEVGEPIEKEGTEQQLMQNSKNPIFVRKDNLKEFQFRIRNITYSQEVYLVEIDDAKQQIVIRTTNKKYYKRIDIPDMQRNNLKLEKEKLSWAYKNNTLIVSYQKPDLILLKENELRKKFEEFNSKKPKEGDIECVTQ